MGAVDDDDDDDDDEVLLKITPTRLTSIRCKLKILKAVLKSGKT